MSWRPIRVTLAGMLMMGFAGRLNSTQASQRAVISLPKSASSPLKFGGAAVSEALTAKGWQAKIGSERSAASLEVVVTVGGSAAFGLTKAPETPESYAISFSTDKHTVFVNGSDDTGAMYGEFELAEQITRTGNNDWRSQLNPASKSPFLEVRGVNMFLTVEDVDNPQGAFWSDDYWDKYLGMMARNRYNFLDIHGLCDAVTLTFPNGFSFFLSLADFPEVGVGAERAAKNLSRLRQVVQMAADHGIKVGYMNYEAPPPIGPWKTRRVGVDERWVEVPQKFLEGPRLVRYTREAVLTFLQQVPGLWMFGFRVGESGQPEDFYKNTYLAALAELPTSQKVYLRTWIADPQRVRELAASTKNDLYIEPKYNGEQLGLPYQASLGGEPIRPAARTRTTRTSRRITRLSGKFAPMAPIASSLGARLSLLGGRCAVANSVTASAFPWSRWKPICRRPIICTTIPKPIMAFTNGWSSASGSGI